MQIEFKALEREFSLLKQYNNAIQAEISRKNEEIKLLEMQVQRLSSSGRQSKYLQIKDCKNCIMYRSQIITLKDQIQHMQRQLLNQSIRERNSQRQITQQSNQRMSRLNYLQNSSKQNHALELEIIQMRGRSQKIITENAELKRMLHQKNLELLRAQNAQDNRQVLQENQRIQQQQAMALQVMQNRIDELQSILQGGQQNPSIVQSYQKQNKQLSMQLSHTRQILNQYSQKIEQLENQRYQPLNRNDVRDPQKNFLHEQLSKANSQRLILSNHISQLQMQNRQNLDKIQDLLRRINVLENSNHNLQAQLRSTILTNSAKSQSIEQNQNTKIILKNLQYELEDLKKYIIHNRPVFCSQQKLLSVNMQPTRDYQPTKDYTQNNSYKVQKMSYPLTSTHFNSMDKMKGFTDLQINGKTPKQQIQIKMGNNMISSKKNRAQLKWQHLQKKIGQLKYQNQNIKKDLKHK